MSPDTEKRLLIFEDELSAVLRVMTRHSNTLSTTLRHAWDGRTLQVMRRDSPVRVSDAHIAINAQTTQHDLDRYMGTTDVFNGFANRFVWACVQRSKFLPEGGGLTEKQIRLLAHRIKRSVDFARQQDELKLSKHALDLWKQTYPTLTRDVTGLVGAATSRAEAQVRRMALIYALMDKSKVVRTKHLRAALAVWKYCEESARVIFGGRSLVTVEDRILGIVKQFPKGCTRTQINESLQHHVRSHLITQALQRLKDNKCVRSRRRKTGGHKAEYWIAI